MIRAIAALTILATAAPAAAQLRADPGQRAFLQCQACHRVRAGEPHKIGPNLNGVYGAKAATRPGYAYSAALKKALLTWDDATLDRWLTRPGQVVPGSKMIFAGMPTADQRKAVIAYLKRAQR